MPRCRNKNGLHRKMYVSMAYLSVRENPERIGHLLGSVAVGGLARHKVKKRVERHAPHSVRVDARHDPFHVQITLFPRASIVADRDEASAELLLVQALETNCCPGCAVPHVRWTQMRYGLATLGPMKRW